MRPNLAMAASKAALMEDSEFRSTGWRSVLVELEVGGRGIEAGFLESATTL